MDLLFSGAFNVAKLTAGIAEGGLPQGDRFFGVSADETRTFVHVPDDATPEELAIINTVIESYDWLADSKASALERLHNDCTSYIFDHYDAARQSSLNALLTEAVMMGWTNRIGYIGPALAWIKGCISYYYEKQDAINNASSKSELEVVNWNFAEQFDSSDPSITLRQASNLTD